MNRLAAWLTTIRGCGWFAASNAGGFPVPAAGPGWVALLALIVGLTLTIVIPREPAMLARAALIIGYIGLSYWTLEPNR